MANVGIGTINLHSPLPSRRSASVSLIVSMLWPFNNASDRDVAFIFRLGVELLHDLVHRTGEFAESFARVA